MIKRLLYGFVILLLAACANTEEQPSPTATLDSTDLDDELIFVEPTLENPPQVPFEPAAEITIVPPTLRPTNEGELFQLAPGTLVVSQTEEANPNITFDYLRLERTGGQEGLEGTPEPLIIEIYNTGEFKRNSEAQAPLSQDQIALINTMMRQINLFGISGDYLGLTPVENEYLYKIFIEREDGTMLLTARNSLLPQEIRAFISLVLQQS